MKFSEPPLGRPQPDPSYLRWVERRKLVEQLLRCATLCGVSYALGRADFHQRMLNAGVAEYVTFGPEPGEVRPTVGLLLAAPFNFAFVLLFSCSVLIVAIAWFAMTIPLPTLFYVAPGMSSVRLGAMLLCGTISIFALVSSVVAIALLCLRPDKSCARAVAYVDAGTQRAIVIFAGAQWHDFFSILPLIWPTKRGLHRGIADAWERLRPSLEDWLDKTGQPAIITGHSLGGALAQIAAFELASTRPIAAAVAFGSERIGKQAIVAEYALRKNADGGSLATTSYHVTLANDPAPRLPPWPLFEHVGRQFALFSTGDLIDREVGIFSEPPQNTLGATIKWTPSGKLESARPERGPLVETISNFATWIFGQNIWRLVPFLRRARADHRCMEYVTALARTNALLPTKRSNYSVL